jgi:hypothetical protein
MLINAPVLGGVVWCGSKNPVHLDSHGNVFIVDSIFEESWVEYGLYFQCCAVISDFISSSFVYNLICIFWKTQPNLSKARFQTSTTSGRLI